MSRSSFAATDARHDHAPRAGVYVLDADEFRRRATIALLTGRDDLRVLGGHAGSAAVLPAVVRALPHVCVVGQRVLAGPVPALVAEIEHALPATPCVRVPSVLGVDPATLSPVQRERQVADAVTFVRSVLLAAGRPARDLETGVRHHFAQAHGTRSRRVPDAAVVAALTMGW